MADIREQAREMRTLWSAFQSSRVLITANNYQVFDHLEKPASAAVVAGKTGTDRRATEILLDALAGIGLLKKQKGKYKNTAQASRFLVAGKPHYQGDIIRHVGTMWESWSNLDTVVKTGTPARGTRNHEAFILGMHNLSSLKAKNIVREIDLAGIRRALDLGGGPGTYAIEMARKGISVTLFDAPDTEKIARKVIAAAGTGRGSVDIVGGDFLNDPIGSGYDLIFISQIVHSYSESVNQQLLKKCRKALHKNGRIVIQEFLVSEDRTRPEWGALFAVNMLVNNDGGRTYTPGEMKTWLLKAGFKQVRKKTVADTVLMSAVK